MTHTKIPKEALTEKATTKLKDPIQKDLLRNEGMGLLRTAKPSKQNISKGERLALKEMKSDESIMILAADKGKATVIMGREEYDKKMLDMLCDRKIYRELKSDPIERYGKKL